MGFQEKPLEKADFIFKLTVPAMVRPASSDKWKAPLDSNVARKKERWKKKLRLVSYYAALVSWLYRCNRQQYGVWERRSRQRYFYTCQIFTKIFVNLLRTKIIEPFLECAVVSLGVYFVVVIWITKCVSLVRTNESLCAKVLFGIAVVTKVTPLKPCDMIVMTEREKETNFRTRIWPCRGRTAMPCRWALRKGELSRISGWYGCAHGLGISKAMSWCRYVTCFWVFREKETFFALSLHAKKMKWESRDHVNVDWEIMRNSNCVRLRLVPYFP